MVLGAEGDQGAQGVEAAAGDHGLAARGGVDGAAGLLQGRPSGGVRDRALWEVWQCVQDAHVWVSLCLFQRRRGGQAAHHQRGHCQAGSGATVPPRENYFGPEVRVQRQRPYAQALSQNVQCILHGREHSAVSVGSGAIGSGDDQFLESGRRTRHQTRYPQVLDSHDVIVGVLLSWGPGPVRERCKELVEIVCANLLMVPIDLPGFSYHKGMLARRELRKMFHTEFALRRSGKFVGNDVLTEMMKAVDPDSSSDKPALDDEELTDNLISIIIAAFETTTTSITWLFNEAAA